MGGWDREVGGRGHAVGGQDPSMGGHGRAGVAAPWVAGTAKWAGRRPAGMVGTAEGDQDRS